MFAWVRGRKVHSKGYAKGMRRVLEGRGLWRPGKKLSHYRFVLALALLGPDTDTDTNTGLCLQCLTIPIYTETK